MGAPVTGLPRPGASSKMRCVDVAALVRQRRTAAHTGQRCRAVRHAAYVAQFDPSDSILSLAVV